MRSALSYIAALSAARRGYGTVRVDVKGMVSAAIHLWHHHMYEEDPSH
jgi:hypothetical protein